MMTAGEFPGVFNVGTYRVRVGDVIGEGIAGPGETRKVVFIPIDLPTCIAKVVAVNAKLAPQNALGSLNVGAPKVGRVKKMTA